MKRQPFSKRTLSLLLIGNLCMGFSLLASTHFNIGDDITDFIKGVGVALIIGGFFLEVRAKRCAARANQPNEKQ